MHSENQVSHILLSEIEIGLISTVPVHKEQAVSHRVDLSKPKDPYG